MIAALSGDGVSDLLARLVKALPEGPWLFPEDQLSDVPMRLLASEITREKLFLQLHQELPHAATVETETWEEFDNGDVRIGQVLFVQRDSPRAIVLGKDGRQIRAIGDAARPQLPERFERQAPLSLPVQVRA